MELFADFAPLSCFSGRMNKFMCMKCDRAFCSPLNLSRHVEKDHDLKFRLRCGVCDLGFTEVSSVIEAHIQVCEGTRGSFAACSCACDNYSSQENMENESLFEASVGPENGADGTNVGLTSDDDADSSSVVVPPAPKIRASHELAVAIIPVHKIKQERSPNVVIDELSGRQDRGSKLLIPKQLPSIPPRYQPGEIGHDFIPLSTTGGTAAGRGRGSDRNEAGSSKSRCRATSPQKREDRASASSSPAPNGREKVGESRGENRSVAWRRNDSGHDSERLEFPRHSASRRENDDNRRDESSKEKRDESNERSLRSNPRQKERDRAEVDSREHRPERGSKTRREDRCDTEEIAPGEASPPKKKRMESAEEQRPGHDEGMDGSDANKSNGDRVPPDSSSSSFRESRKRLWHSDGISCGLCPKDARTPLTVDHFFEEHAGHCPICLERMEDEVSFRRHYGREHVEWIRIEFNHERRDPFSHVWFTEYAECHFCSNSGGRVFHSWADLQAHTFKEHRGEFEIHAFPPNGAFPSRGSMSGPYRSRGGRGGGRGGQRGYWEQRGSRGGTGGWKRGAPSF